MGIEMGSRSKSGKRRKGSRKTEVESFDFWQSVLDAINWREDGQRLSWNERALLYTRFAARMPNFCELHGLGCPDGYINVIRRLVEGERLEFFDRDALKRIKKLLCEITQTAKEVRTAGVDLVMR